MNTSEIIVLARRHMSEGAMESSARLCLYGAVALYDDDRPDDARKRAIDSLRYSVGEFHEDFRRATRSVQVPS